MVIKRLMVNPTQMPMTIDDFVWRRPTDGLSSMKVNIGPYLEDLGTVPIINREAVWLAAAAFLTDRTVRRGMIGKDSSKSSYRRSNRMHGMPSVMTLMASCPFLRRTSGR